MNGQTGIVCPIDDGALARAVLDLCADDAGRESMGEAAIERARTEFSRTGVAEQVWPRSMSA